MIRITIEVETEEDDIGDIARRFKENLDQLLLDLHNKRRISHLQVKHIAERYRRKG